VRFEFEVEIERPVRDVFAYVTDVGNLPKWQRATSEAAWVGGEPPGTGARIRQKTRFLGRTMDIELEVTAYETERRFDLRTLKGPISFTVRHSFQPSDGGTKIQFVGEGEAGGFFRLAEAVVAKQAERESRADFDRLKAVLESA
jgi:uncharacterized protein YndB with AHSA1/START domain